MTALFHKMTVLFQRSKLLVLISVCMIVGYVVFFTSTLWLGQNKNYAYTPIMQELTLNGRQVFVARWDYSPNQKLMEVEIEVNNSTLDNVDNYYFSAVTKPAGNIEVVPIIEDSNFIVLHLKNIPKNFTEISLRMKVGNDNYKDILKMYSNVDQTNQVSEIKALTKDEYYINRTLRTIEQYQDQINKINTSIINYKENITALESKNVTLEADKKYQSDAEIQDTQRLIESNKSAIENIKQLIVAEENNKRELETRIVKAKEKIESIKK